LSEAIRLNPEYARAHYGRGVAYRMKGDLDKAIADYTEAIRLNPRLAAAYNERGLSYGEMQQDDRALADCSEAIRLDPNMAGAYVGRGAAYCQMQKYDRASDMSRSGIAEMVDILTVPPSKRLKPLTELLGEVWMPGEKK
jgi:tetratricopeptide (TPR) repeat protein